MRNIREIPAGNVVTVCFNRELVYAIAMVEPRIFVLNLELYGRPIHWEQANLLS